MSRSKAAHTDCKEVEEDGDENDTFGREPAPAESPWLTRLDVPVPRDSTSIQLSAANRGCQASSKQRGRKIDEAEEGNESTKDADGCLRVCRSR